jgi:hypothetical protein
MGGGDGVGGGAGHLEGKKNGAWWSMVVRGASALKRGLGSMLSCYR